MKILALETSSQRGSVALFEGTSRFDATLRAYVQYEAYNEHAERLLGLLDAAFEQAKLSKNEVDRIAVGVGPGSFTGVRVALAVAQGLMVGLGVQGVGLGSLRALAFGLPSTDQRTRIVVRDARRDEYFVAVYSAEGDELVAPYTIEQRGASEYLLSTYDNQFHGGYVVVGTSLNGLSCSETEQTREPDARAVGQLAFGLDPQTDLVEPQYVRGPNVVRPNLPVSPLLLARS